LLCPSNPISPCASQQRLINEFKEGMKRAMGLARNRGVKDHIIIPHLDDAQRLGAFWRNNLIFSPTYKWVWACCLH
jgi:hypothetical protein